MDMLETLKAWVLSTGIKVVIALIILVVGFAIVSVVCNKLQEKLEKQNKVDQTLARTLCYAAKIGLKLLICVCLVGYLGIETSGISAVIASLGVCAGLAVNGTLSNLAGGVMILITRPFSVGDYIEACGQSGTVTDILICYTKIATVDNKIVYLPNSAVSTGTVVNFSEAENRRVDLEFSVGGNDPVLVRNTLLEIAEQNPLVLADPAPFARITDFGAGNGLKVTLRMWTKSANYWDVYLGTLETAHDVFAEKGINIPFNRVDVVMKQ